MRVRLRPVNDVNAHVQTRTGSIIDNYKWLRFGSMQLRIQNCAVGPRPLMTLTSTHNTQTSRLKLCNSKPYACFIGFARPMHFTNLYNYISDTGISEGTLAKIPFCWASRLQDIFHILFHNIYYYYYYYYYYY